MRAPVRWPARAWRSIRTAISPDATIVKAPAHLRADWDVPVVTRDGTTLRVNLFRPSGEGPWPVIMTAHPYGKDRIPAKTKSGRGLPIQMRLVPQPKGTEISEWTSWEAPDPVFWTEQGYAVVNADLRGCGTSEGTAELFSDQEAQDYADLIGWAASQAWSSGRVGLDGVSYLAISQYKVAALRPKGLAAMCPWEGFVDLYRDFAYPGGVREDGFSALWSRVTKREVRSDRPTLRQETLARPNRDDWYDSVAPRIEDIAVPMLVCGSFSDQLLHTRGSFDLFRRAGSTDKWLYTHRDGKWCTYYGKDATNTRLEFFDHFLKDRPNGWPERPPVRLAINESGPDAVAVTWEQNWPPNDLDWRRLRLEAGEGKLTTRGGALAAATAIVRAPRGRVSLDWTVPEDLDVIGPMALSLVVELLDARDMNLFVEVRKIDAAGEVPFEGSYGYGADSVSKGWLRLAHRRLDERRSGFAEPTHLHDIDELLEPGVRATVAIALRPHATRFRKGDVLRVEIGARWPRSRNPLSGQFPAGYLASRRGTCLIHTGGESDCHLLLGTRPT